MPARKGIYLFTLIGLVLGFTLDALIRNQNSHLFYYASISLFALLYTLAYNEKNCVRLIVSSLVATLFLSLPLIPISFYVIPIPTQHWLTFLFAFPLFAYVGHSFHYAYHQDNNWRISYYSLFAAVWNTIPLIFVATFFAALANLLMLLGAFIFKTVGSDFLWNVFFDNPHFRLISDVTLFFIGLGVGQQNIKIIYSLRFLLLRIMYYLFPFLALISVLYFVLYISHAITNGQEYIDPLTVLIPLVSLGIIFFNAYFQDGCTETGAPSWLKRSLRIYRVILFFLVLIMSYKIFHANSIDVNLVIYILAIFLYSLTYALTALFSENMEQKWVRVGNITSALVFLIALFLCNLPYMPIAFNVGFQSTAPLTVIIQQN